MSIVRLRPPLSYRDICTPYSFRENIYICLWQNNNILAFIQFTFQYFKTRQDNNFVMILTLCYAAVSLLQVLSQYLGLGQKFTSLYNLLSMAALCNVRVGRLYSVYSQYCMYTNKNQFQSFSTSCLYTTQGLTVELRLEQCGWVAYITNTY